MTASNVGVVLARYPHGSASESDFALVDVATSTLDAGDVLVRNVYLSCDPYLRGRMAPGGFSLGEPIPARVVGVVEESRHRSYHPGDIVWGFLRWERYTLVRAGEGLTRVDPALGPIRYAVSVLGMPGLTAHVGAIEIGRPEPGQTVLVSAASGAVGSIAGQLARLAGARVVGSVGRPEKVTHVTTTLGFDAAFDHRAATAAAAGADGRGLDEALAQHCPDGIDVYFENVGGPLLEAVLKRLNPHARIAVCGMIAEYEQSPDATPIAIKGLTNIMTSRVTMTGLSIYDHVHKLPEFVPRMAEWLRSGQVVFPDDIVEGIEQTPAAFVGMMRGDHLGKRMVRVSDDPHPDS